MAEIVNLRQARKRKARADKERAADQNRLQHGRTRSDLVQRRLASEKANRLLDGHRLEPHPPSDDK